MKNVLIVDDEKSLLLSIKAGFEAYKDRFHLFTAEDGKKAVDILKSNLIDLVVTDIRMPEMDGFELLVYMNTHFPSIPAIVMSAYGTREIEGKFESIGIDGFLDKPVNFSDLVKCIEEGLKRSSQGGTVTGISVSSFLQLIEMEEKTCLLEVHGKDKKGLFYFDQGTLYDAVCGSLLGEEAAIEMVMWNHVRLSFKNLPDKKIMRRINSELMPILMEASRRKDEALSKGDFSESPELEIDMFKPVNDFMEFSEIGKNSEKLLPDRKYPSGGNQPMKVIMTLFREMAMEMDGAMMIALIDMDGIVVVEYNTSQISSDVFAARFAKVMGIMVKTVKEMDSMEDLEETIVQTRNAWMVCRMAAPAFYLGVVVNRASTLGNIRLVVGKYLDKVRQLLV